MVTASVQNGNLRATPVPLQLSLEYPSEMKPLQQLNAVYIIKGNIPHTRNWQERCTSQ